MAVRLTTGVLLTIGMIIAPLGAGASVSCDVSSLQKIAPANTTIENAAAKTSGGASYCAASAQITTSKAKNDFIHFELDLPDNWNGRFVFFGSGGFGGAGALNNTVTSPDYAADLQAGFALAATDMGNRAQTSQDASWALNNLPAVKDFAYRATHKSTVAAKAVVAKYYAATKSASFNSYFYGCSTGGRQALVEAQKYPADFDGIVAGDPAIGDPFIDFNWNAQNYLAGPSTYIDPAAVNLVNDAVLAACDVEDGVTDGLVQDPSSCTFDAASLQCGTSGNPTNPPGCLTSGQVAAFDAIYAGARDTKGIQLYPGFSKTDPGDTSDPSVPPDPVWEQWITGCLDFTNCVLPNFVAAEPWSPTSPPPTQWVFQDQFLKFMVFNDPTYDSRTFSFTDQKSINTVTNKSKRWGGNGMNAHLKPFTKLGHKLLMYHGWSDPALSPFVSVNYYTSVQAVLGSSTTDSVRLFMVPGMHHCGGGPGPNVFDALTPVINWFENGTPPNGNASANPPTLIASHYTNNDPTLPIDRTMPLCAYPTLAQWGGVNDVTQATSWSCPPL